MKIKQHLMERFNSDSKIFVMILCTRSGGVGVNLMGADTVTFYDTWRPKLMRDVTELVRLGMSTFIDLINLL